MSMQDEQQPQKLVVAARSYSRLSLTETHNRLQLLKRVRAAWIDGLLKRSLHQEAQIKLHLQHRPDTLKLPCHMVVEEAGRKPRPLPMGSSLVDVYDEADGDLLILGEPGAGKTTLLLELADVLLARAETDEQQGIPVVLHLASWAQKRLPFREWLIEELWLSYQIPRSISQKWVEDNWIVPLLDGLDEVVEDARATCFQEIIRYSQSRPAQDRRALVVCSRSTNDITLFNPVASHRYVDILPFPAAQVDTYLKQADEQTSALRQTLEKKAELRALADQPLMLAMLTLASQASPIGDVPAGATRQETLYSVVVTYVETMLGRARPLRQWKTEQAMDWLAFLAGQMQRHNQVIFSLEGLQADWLADTTRFLYHVSHWLILELLFATVFGPLLGLVDGQPRGLILALVFGLACGLGVNAWKARAQPADVHIWSWKEMWNGPVLGLAGALVGAGGGIVTVLGFGLGCGLAYGLYCVPSGERLPDQFSLSPDASIWRTGRNGLFAGLLVSLAVGLFCGTLIGQIQGLESGLLVGVIGGLLFGIFSGLVCGLADAAQHVLVRFWLWRSHRLPWELVSFLDEMTRRLLLRKVGGRYIFAHHLLLEYFATLEK